MAIDKQIYELGRGRGGLHLGLDMAVMKLV